MLLTPLLLSATWISAPLPPPAGNEAATSSSSRASWFEFVPIPGERGLTSRLIVRPLQREAFARAGLTLEQIWARRAAARHALERFELVHYVPQTDEYVVRLREAGSEQREASALMATGDFEYVEPDWLLSPSVCAPPPQSHTQQGAHRPATPQLPTRCPNDSAFAGQWHLQASILNACAAWQYHTGDPGIGVGVCDTGVRTTHEDLLLHRLEGYNAVDRLWESQGGQIGPAYNHGTRTTGCVAANGNNGIAVSGVGWNLSHRMLRVSNLSDGGAYLSDLQHAARTSIESGDKVANVSYAGAYLVSNLATASYIKSIGGLLVWAAGNEGATLSFSNRDADDLIVVGASDAGDGLASFSNRGSYVDLVAPGVNISTTDSSANNSYTQSASGTSFAAPLVSGVCAMLWSARPQLSPNDVERLLKLGARDVGTPGIDDLFGYGRADLYASLTREATAVPDAMLAGYPTSGISPLAVNFRDLSTGVPTSWSWDFGDGTTSTQQNPSHAYASSGSYTVTLTTTNALGADSTARAAYILVDIIPPVAAFSASTSGGVSPLSVTFTDASSGGLPTAWAWSFGDGATSTQRNPTHVYTASGYYTVSLQVSNAYGSDTLTQSNLITVDYIPPVAGFSGTPTSGNSPFVVQFTDESTGGVTTSWYWNFGDGGGSSLQHPSHTYTIPGTYSVGLFATNAYGTNTLWRTGYIHVGPGPEILANFVGSPTTGNGPLTVQFTDQSVGNIILWEWDFGDNTTSNLQNPTHVYTTPGDYDVSLQVTNSNGNDDQKNRNSYVIVN